MATDPAHSNDPSGSSLALWRQRLGKLRHDLRNPLSDILGFTEIMADDARERQLGALEGGLESIRLLANHILGDVNHALSANTSWSNVDGLENLKRNIPQRVEEILASARELSALSVEMQQGTFSEDLLRVTGAAQNLRDFAPGALDGLIALATTLGAGAGKWAVDRFRRGAPPGLSDAAPFSESAPSRFPVRNINVGIWSPSMPSHPPALIRRLMLAFLVTGLAFTAQAQPVAYSNLGVGASFQSGNPFANNVNLSRGGGPELDGAFAVSFVPGTTGILSQARAGVGSIFGNPGGLKLSFYSNSSGAPGGSLDFATVPSVTTTVALSTFSYVGGATLTSGLTYWAVLTLPEPSLSTNAQWYFNDQSFVGLSQYQTSSWVSVGGSTPALEVIVSPVPEPSTYAAIAGAAMLGFAIWRRSGPR